MTAGCEWPKIAALTNQCALAHCHSESASSATAGLVFQMLLNRLQIYLLGFTCFAFFECGKDRLLHQENCRLIS
jgi:hypothetical protein